MVDKHSAPAFSMRGPHNTVKHPTSAMPGPGAYESISYLQNSKSNSNRKEGQRFKQIVSQVPGPGTYSQISNKDHIPTAMVRSRSREVVVSSQEVPGPGSYNPNFRKVVKGDEGYTIGGSSRIGDIIGQARKVPGPGDYETNRSTMVNDNASRMGNQQRPDMVLNHYTPGPGQYDDSHHDLKLRKEPIVTFGKSGRSSSTSNFIPGPGTYAPTNSFQDLSRSKGFSMNAKPSELPVFATKVPGPGAYVSLEAEVLKRKGISFSIGKGSRLQMDNEKEIIGVPGPERYIINHGAMDNRTNAFGKGKRSSLANETQVPGPGSYASKYQSTLPGGFSIPKQKTGWIKGSSNPGPGSYDYRLSQSEYNSVKMKLDPRRPFYDEKKGIPGPGAYENSLPSQKGVGYKIGNQKKCQMQLSSNPGPGNYDIPTTVSNLPKYTHR